ncbi:MULTISPECIES: hypothetical protein [Halobacteriovorax]|uniref:Lipoprotein n=1 Tax=Halobacteriovorax vibrionivorans TaxID=2152716 RepID=A0ABY0IC82_9BACT|nr:MULTISPECIES: hypothetical protein [Halobacteriovorax]AYF44499.1 hypothetical protein BALOs_1498 [Halobacteriovorax sp. BALOs_7]RZF20556.1 hypothetical protein DAY19_11260 [Halobacteriovorax vibrionivorans]TGD47469.1 hypothetical protein EP118_07790 [Halobacteriovorax sp. Y22]
MFRAITLCALLTFASCSTMHHGKSCSRDAKACCKSDKKKKDCCKKDGQCDRKSKKSQKKS